MFGHHNMPHWSRAVKLKATRWLMAGVLTVAAACDKDPSRPVPTLSLTACPTGLVDVGQAITLAFSAPIAAGSLTPGNVIVSDGITGLEIPGSISLVPGSSTQVRFRPSQNLPFDRPIRVRIQNLLSAPGNSPIPVTVCELRTVLPPVQELVWRALPSAGGNDLLGASLVGPNMGFVITRAVPLFYSDGGPFRIVSAPPRYSAGADVAFISPSRGFASYEDRRSAAPLVKYVLAETRDAGVTFDSVFTTNASQTRLFFRPVGLAPNDVLFGVVGGGVGDVARLIKYDPVNRKAGAFTDFFPRGSIGDIDFANDTTRGAAVSQGVAFGSSVTLGAVFVSSDGGTSWSEIPGSVASQRVRTYKGVAIRNNGEIYVAGGNKYFARYTPSSGGTYSAPPTEFNVDPALVNLDSASANAPNGLIFTDVQFDRTDDTKGWLIGAQLVGFVNGVPRYEGLIYRIAINAQGNPTFTRQGVAGAPDFGRDFPRLNRISLLTPTSVWLVGDGGAVLTNAP
ncbi:MAG: hypothetical protein NVS1B4_08090 [Gemmatimonadaceae bacterium]